MSILTIIGCLLGALLAVRTEGAEAESLRIYPAPAGEPPSADYALEVQGKPVFVYQAKVRHAISKPPNSIWTHEMGAAAETASFAYFDFAGTASVAVTPSRAFKSATLHPTSFGIKPSIEGRTVRFELDRPRKLTLLLDGSDQRPLHLFASALEANPPKPGDENVLYFGPGVHRIGTTYVKSGQTVYIAGGAIVKGQILPSETPKTSARTGLKHYESLLVVRDVSKVRICGRGILDGGDLPHASKALVALSGSTDVQVEGIVIRDSPNWAVLSHGCQRVSVADIKEISGRLNSDGINSVNSRAIRIRDCFVRNRDDSIVVKTTQPQGEAADIAVEDCIVWNDWGYAFGVTYETRAPIHDVTFRNCDILHVQYTALGIHVVDSGTISNVRFEDIRVELTRDKLIRLNIGHDMWATDPQRGHIRAIQFKNVSVTGGPFPASEILGLDADHRVEDVAIDGLRIHGQAIKDASQGKFTINAHTKDIRFTSE